MDSEQMRVLVLVKASPVLTSRLEETMCVAGMRLDSDRAWVRLHPVPFRDLGDDSKFAKHQTVNVEVIRHGPDRRPESWDGQRAGPILVTMSDHLLRVPEVARRLHMDGTEVYTIIERGELPAGKGKDGLVYVTEREVPGQVAHRTLEVDARSTPPARRDRKGAVSPPRHTSRSRSSACVAISMARRVRIRSCST